VRRLALLLTAIALLAGCGGEQAARPGGTTETAEPPQTGTGSAPPPETSGLGVYFLRGESVVPVHRQVPQTEAVGTAAVEALLAGPTDEERDLGLTSTVPDGTRLLGLTVADGTATVDLSREFESGGGSLSMTARLAQITFTLTQFPTVERVWLAVQGEPVYVLGGEGIPIDEPLMRDRFGDLTPLILVEHPALGETVSSPLQVSGTASVFEATLRVRLVGPDGEALWEDTVTASDGAPARGTFAVGIPFTAAGEGKLVVFSPSAADGSEQHTFEVPITLAP
jgi:germination protein M